MSPESITKPQVAKIEEREQLTTEHAAKTFPKRRKESESGEHLANEDRVLADPVHRAFGAFDGMGGHKAGKVASEIACNYIFEHLSEIQNGTSVEEAQKALLKIVIEASTAIYEASKLNPEYKGMGTTLALIKFHTDAEGREWKIIVNVGDSRIYEFDENNAPEQLTVDDDFLSDLGLSPEEKERTVRQIDEALSLKDLSLDVSKKLANYCFGNRHIITKCMGKETLSPSISVSPVKAGDRFLIITDGTHKSFSDTEFKNVCKEIVSKSATRHDIIENLIQRSLKKSKEPKEKNFRAEQDDMSAIFLKLK